MELRNRIFVERDEQENDIEKNMRYPLYEQCYVKALNSILGNIVRYRKEEDSNIVDELSLIMPENIYAFLGRRGSGKTTAVTDFLGILRNISVNGKYWEKRCDILPSFFEKSTEFIFLNLIDASMFDTEEDLLELIWSEMFRLLEERHANQGYVAWMRNSGIRKETRDEFAYMEEEGRIKGVRNNNDALYAKIIKGFDDLYKNYSSLGQKKDADDLSYSSSALLRNMSSSGKVRDLFNDLLDMYFLFMRGDVTKEPYLVITIDDLDLNLKYAYRMLEQIYKYLGNHRVIVLLTADLEQIRLVGEKDCSDKLKRLIHHENKKIENKSHELTVNALNKILPDKNRIYLPDEEVFTNDTVVMGSIDKREKNEQNVNSSSVKEYLLKKIANRTMVHYDMNGIKTHFFVPKRVRGLVLYDNFLDMLYKIEAEELGEDAEQKNRYYNNMQYFINDINERMAEQLLDSEQWDNFQLIKAQNIERKAQYVVRVSHFRRLREEFRDDLNESNYSYCDLLESIYCWGRERYEDKVLIHIILASFTAEMTREYNKFMYGSDEEKRRSYRVLKRLIMDGFGNKWMEELIPYVYRLDQSGDETSERKGLGFIENSRSDMMNWGYEYDYNGQVNQKNNWKVVEPIVENLLTLFSEKLVVRELECLMFFFGKKQSDDWSLKCRLESEDGKNKLIVSFEHQLDFDVLGFLGKTIYDFSWYEKVQTNITSLLCDAILQITGLENSDLKDKILAIVRNYVKKMSIWKKNNLFKNIRVFPFYSLDIAYNVLKRVRRKCKNEVRRINTLDIVQHIRKIYGYIAYELYKEDVRYSNKIKFADVFLAAPFLSEFGVEFEIDEQDELMKQLYDKYAKKLNGKISNMFGENLSKNVRIIADLSTSIQPYDLDKEDFIFDFGELI